MKAQRTFALVLALAVSAAAAYGALTRRAAHDILITSVTAAPIAGQDGTVGVFASFEALQSADHLINVPSPTGQAVLVSAPETGLAMPSGSTPSLALDGAHVQITGVDGALDEGRMLPLTLRFERAGEVNVRARLAAPKEMGHAGHFGLHGMGGICRVEEGEPVPQITLDVQPDGSEWVVRVTTQDFAFTPDLVDGLHVPGTGHGHVYLDGLKLQRLYGPEARIGALPPGQCTVQITLNTNDHRAYVVGDTAITAEAQIVVP